MQAYYLSSFIKDDAGGNMAAVIIDDGSLSDRQRQQIATDIGFSETAYVRVVDDKTLGVRFFTPNTEVGLCGHATLAAVELALREGIMPCSDRISIISQEGKINIEINTQEDGSNIIFMEQLRSKFAKPLEDEELLSIASSLGLEKADIGCKSFRAVPRAVYTGLWDIICPVASLEKLKNLRPSMEKIRDISRKYDVTGFHCIYLDEDCNKVYARNFAPLVGIDEESATGTSSGAACAYIADAAGLMLPFNTVFYQGQWMESPSIIYVKLDDNLVPWVGGKVKIVSRETISASKH